MLTVGGSASRTVPSANMTMTTKERILRRIFDPPSPVSRPANLGGLVAGVLQQRRRTTAAQRAVQGTRHRMSPIAVQLVRLVLAELIRRRHNDARTCSAFAGFRQR